MAPPVSVQLSRTMSAQAEPFGYPILFPSDEVCEKDGLMKIPATLSQRIEDEIANLRPEPLGHINYEGIHYRGLPLFGTIGEVWLLRPDGSFWKVDSDLGVPLQPLPDGLHMMALA